MTPDKLTSALKQAVKDGAQIVNGSFGSFKLPSIYARIREQLASLLEKSVFERCFETNCGKDVLFVFAVGNNEPGKEQPNDFSKTWPASLSLTHDNVISVTRVEATPSSFVPDPSRALVAQGGNVTVAAPGVVFTTFPNPKYEAGAGTSFATPMVSGLAGLLLTRNNQLTPKQLKEIIIGGACLGGESLVNSVDGEPNIPVINAFESVKLADNPDAGKRCLHICH